MSDQEINHEAPAAAPPPPAQALPVFYHRIEMLDPAKHANLRLNRASGFQFAATTNSISICLQEIIPAADFFPIVFTEAALTPIAVVGCRDGENVFVDAAGRWRPGVYIPAYLRSWPFIPLNTPTPEQLVLGIEADSDHLRADSGVPLFEDGNPTAVLKDIAALAISYRNNVTETREFVQALDAAGVLHNNGASLKFRNGDTLQLRGYKSLDAAKFDALADETILEWRRRRWLPAIYTILRSVVRWAPLVELTEGRRVATRSDSVNNGLPLGDVYSQLS